MKIQCSKSHTPIEWDDKDLFCCPACLQIDVRENQRKVIENLSVALRKSLDVTKLSQDKVNSLLKKLIDSKEPAFSLHEFKEEIFNLQNA